MVERGKLNVAGPDLIIGPKAVLSLSMLLHELATNAVKHGSLAVETGKVFLDWRVDHAPAAPMVVLTWQERGGPAAAEPEKTGMGSRLIKTGLIGTGESVLRYDPLGFSAEFRAPLATIINN